MRPRLALAVCAAAALVLPPAAHAAHFTIGSKLGTPNTYDNLSSYCGTLCTGSNLNLSTSSTATDGLTAPIDGVIVTWRVKSGSQGNPVALRVLRPNGGTNYTAQGASETRMTASGEAEFPTRVSIQKNDSIGLDIHNAALVWNSNSFGASGVVWGSVNNFPNGLPQGMSGSGDAQSKKELLVQAVMEPDADKDGFGDESQDQCPANPDTQTPPCETGGGGGGGGGQDTTAPVITGFKVEPRRFRIGHVAHIIGSVSEHATLTLKFRRLVPGRVRGGKCVRQTPRVQTGKRCTARLAVGSSVRDADGAFSIAFNGSLAGSPRPPGRYRLIATAADAAGNVSKPKTTRFRLRK